jgi:ribosomal protein L11
LVCGIHDGQTQKKLLAVDKLTLTQAIEIAQGMEAAEMTARALKGGYPAVHLVAKPCCRGA